MQQLRGETEYRERAEAQTAVSGVGEDRKERGGCVFQDCEGQG